MQVTKNFEFPEPQSDQQMDTIADVAAQATEMHQFLTDHDFPKEAARHALRTVAELRDRFYTLRRTVGLAAVAEGTMTQVEVANLLHVHPQTVGRWVQETRDNPEPDRDYSVDYLHGFHCKREPR